MHSKEGCPGFMAQSVETEGSDNGCHSNPGTVEMVDLSLHVGRPGEFESG